MSLRRELVAVAAGAVVGTGLRLAVNAALPHADTEFPLSTLVINTVGSFVLAVLVVRVWPVAPAWLRAGVGPGVLGSFTTFSAVGVAVIPLMGSGQFGAALGFIALTFVLGLGAAGLGLVLGRRVPSAPEVSQ